MAKAEVEIGIYKFTLSFPKLTKKLQEKLPVDFEYLKIKGWLSIFNDENAYVNKWNQPTVKGLSAKCKPLENYKQYIEHAKQVKAYADEVNTRLGTGFIVDIPKEGEDFG